jgi:hypothetical protein
MGNGTWQRVRMPGVTQISARDDKTCYRSEFPCPSESLWLHENCGNLRQSNRRYWLNSEKYLQNNEHFDLSSLYINLLLPLSRLYLCPWRLWGPCKATSIWSRSLSTILRKKPFNSLSSKRHREFLGKPSLRTITKLLIGQMGKPKILHVTCSQSSANKLYAVYNVVLKRYTNSDILQNVMSHMSHQISSTISKFHFPTRGDDADN